MESLEEICYGLLSVTCLQGTHVFWDVDGGFNWDTWEEKILCEHLQGRVLYVDKEDGRIPRRGIDVNWGENPDDDWEGTLNLECESIDVIIRRRGGTPPYGYTRAIHVDDEEYFTDDED